MWKLQVFLALHGGRRPRLVSLFSRLKSESPLWTVFSKQCNIDTPPHTPPPTPECYLYQVMEDECYGLNPPKKMIH